ncbi:MAG TPA: cation:proton antiporter [Verrucomicrobiae bacterium]|jgi:Kef-type K+ transport system membrane component KefB|nr:cation:proton antiporter [Verrucomicrobiae bacterium]
MRANAVAGLVYAVIVIGCGLGIYLTLQSGRRLEPVQAAPTISARPEPSAAASTSQVESWWQGTRDALREPLALLLIQLILIVALARFFAAQSPRLGQPAVIGEMIAGIVLGPSVVGAIAPGFFESVFPAGSMGALRMLSQVGIILFMFVVGMELDLKQMRGQAQTAVLVSHVSIVLPFFLGALFSLFIYESFSSRGVTFSSFALFMGVAMSMTAFPVLARILAERGLTKSHLGSMALTCAAVADMTAWTILAFVVAVVKSRNPDNCLISIGLLILFVSAMLWVVRPLLRRLPVAQMGVANAPTQNMVVAVLVVAFGAGLLTEVIGIHALFGAFLAGVCMPQGSDFRQRVRERLESFSAAFLLPLFFAFTGLRTQIGLLSGWQSVGVCLGLIAVATLGKLGGSMLIARWSGMDWHDSFALGALMNTRGLVELIVLNIGFDLGILSPKVFSMMVVMALVTTCMTGPLLSLGDFLRRRSRVTL